MKPIFRIALICLLLDSCGKSFDTKKFYSFPKYKEVYESFFKKYTAKEGTYVEFAKKPEGYYVVVKDYEGKLQSEHLYWSMEKKSYEDVPKDAFTKSEYYNEGGMYGMMYSFDHNLYFNYDGAHEASIAELEDVTDLDDTLTEALARAYSGKSSDLLGKMAMGEPRKALPKENLQEFCELVDKMLAAYKIIMDRNPDYETIIGRVRTKWANEHLYAWNELEISGFKEEAKKYLADNLYDELILNFAKNTLDCCAKNAILFTNGDNDSFPLWYAQEKLGYRTDVAVINTSLINLPVYIDYSCKRYNLKTTLPQNKYNDDITEIIYSGSRVAATGDNGELNEDMFNMGVLKYIEMIKTGNPLVFGDNAGKKYLTVPTLELLLPVNTSRFQADSTLQQLLRLTIKNGYFYRSDLFQLDLIGTNNWERPICYASSGRYHVLSLFPQYNHRVLVDEITPYIHGQTPDYIHTPEVNELLLKKLNFNSGDSKKFQSEGIVRNYMMEFTIIARENLNVGDTITCLALMNQFEQLFPNLELNDTEYLIITMSELYYNCGELKKAEKLAEKVIGILEKKTEKEMEREESQRLFSMLMYLNERAFVKENAGFQNRIKKLLDSGKFYMPEFTGGPAYME